MRTIEMTPEEIREEVRSLRSAGEKVAATRESALAFLVRIGAETLPPFAHSANGAKPGLKKSE